MNTRSIERMERVHRTILNEINRVERDHPTNWQIRTCLERAAVDIATAANWYRAINTTQEAAS